MLRRLPLRARITLLCAAPLAAGAAALLLLSLAILSRHLHRTLPAADADAIASSIGAQYALALAGAALMAAGTGWLAAGQALAPLRRIGAVARRVSTERLDERIALDGPDDEVRELARTIDDMLERLNAAVEQQRRFIANASHELRTPLTVIRAEADVALADPDAGVAELRAMGRGVIEGSDRADALLDGLLVLALSGGGARRDELVELSGLARTAADELGAEAALADVSLRVRGEPAWVRGDAALLGRLVANLLENAVRHAPGSAATVEVAAAGDRALIEVRNGGRVIDPRLAARLAEPFQRLDRHRSSRGVGLGLSIVDAVARAHGGSLALDAPPEGGLRARVALPKVLP